jgi:hypothetical protein
LASVSGDEVRLAFLEERRALSAERFDALHSPTDE